MEVASSQLLKTTFEESTMQLPGTRGANRDLDIVTQDIMWTTRRERN